MYDNREVFCDSKSVVNNFIIPASGLNKMHDAICYHREREAHAPGVFRVLWIPEEFNLVYFLQG